MTLLSYPFPSLAVVSFVLVLATIAVPLFAFVWLVVFLVAALVVVVTLAWALVAASRAVGRRLARWLYAATRLAREREPWHEAVIVRHSRRRKTSGPVSGRL